MAYDLIINLRLNEIIVIFFIIIILCFTVYQWYKNLLPVKNIQKELIKIRDNIFDIESLDEVSQVLD
jgi:hypothetical protein